MHRHMLFPNASGQNGSYVPLKLRTMPHQLLRCSRLSVSMLKSLSVARKPYAIGRFSWLSQSSSVLALPLMSASFQSRQPFATASSSSPYDPLALRPNKICDPYGQGGKPLSRQEAKDLLSTVHDDWMLIQPETNNDDDTTPCGLERDFFHKDMMDGAQFVAKIAAVGTIHNHYPSILLERRLLPKAWQVVTRVTCRTPTLEGLSYNDFYIAMVSLVE